MTLWLDAHLSPRIARWITERFGISAKPLGDLGLRDAGDAILWMAAREAEVVFMPRYSPPLDYPPSLRTLSAC
jgi:predicted nuclease of predicted toxin-antitoxin system